MRKNVWGGHTSPHIIIVVTNIVYISVYFSNTVPYLCVYPECKCMNPLNIVLIAIINQIIYALITEKKRCRKD